MVERAVIPDESECWSAVVSRDAAADGHFVYAVVTTGIYCRPSCPTPTPLRRNVCFFSDPAAAEAEGTRIEWRTLGGRTKSISVLTVQYQPEAHGHDLDCAPAMLG
jgi:AraC family transcriptional regulator, regulatory protein of adaptative response / methylated-DNA-[protein]-cysteine methyltransferase